MAVITSARRAETIKTEGLHNVADVRRLYLEVSWRQRGEERSPANGVTRSWIYRFKSPITGKVRNMGLGSSRDLGFADAKEKALAAAKQLLEGKDPIIERDREREATRQAYQRDIASRVTFKDVAESYLKKHLPSFRNDKNRHQWKTSLERAGAAFGSLNVAEIDQGAVVKFLSPIWDSAPVTASRIRGRVEKVLDAARAAGLRDGENPARWTGHLEHLLSARPKIEHHSAMPVAAVPAFMARLRERETMSARALEFAILTASRSGEARGAEWREIDLEARTWTVPASLMKASREHTVPLSDRAVAILKALPDLGVYVFPGAQGQPMTDAALMRLLQRMDANCTVHGFRSSFRDWAGDLGHFDREVVEHGLAHGLPDATEAAYRRGTALNKRQLLMQSWSDYCGGKLTAVGNVVALHG